MTDRVNEQRANGPTVLGVIALAATVGLGWGLAFGLADALPVLLEGDLLAAPGRRLLALTYVAVFYELVFGLLLALAGGIVWGALLLLTRRRARQADLLGLFGGLCVALSTVAYLLLRYQEATMAIVFVLALAAGGIAGWLLRAFAVSNLAASPGRLRTLQALILGLLGAGVMVLFGAATYRHTLRDWAVFNPRVTDLAPTPERPNIVLISIDALRADGLGAYGNQPEVSPSIDALARRGVVFREAISQASSTVPSVASFLTSLYPTELGMIEGRDWSVDDKRVTLAEAMQVAGYRTQAYVANGFLVPAKGYAQGFDGYVGPAPGRPDSLDQLRTRTAVVGLACRHQAFPCDAFEAGYGLLFDRLLSMWNEGGRINALARRFIGLHRNERFFLWLHYMEPHATYNPRMPYGDLPEGVTAGRESFLRDWIPAITTTPMVTRPDDLTAVQALYDGEVLEADAWVRGIWEEIEGQGLADRTLLAITADHGEEFAEHGGFSHGHTVYRELEHVPLILIGPQVTTPGRVVETPVPMLDLMPTLLDAAGGPPLPDLAHGLSLLPALQGEDPPPRPIYTESPPSRSAYDERALRQGDYKLVYNARLDQTELYNLRDDPGEQHDISEIEPQRVATMRDDLRAWTASVLKTWAELPKSGGEVEELDAAIQEALHQIGY